LTESASVLTEAGEILRAHAQQVELEQAQIAVQELEGLQRGELTVGTVQTVNAYMIPVWLLVSQLLTTISLHIQELSADEIGLEQGRLHLGISFASSTSLLDWRLSCCLRRNGPDCPCNSSSSWTKSGSFCELDKEPLILHISTRRLVDKGLQAGCLCQSVD